MKLHKLLLAGMFAAVALVTSMPAVALPPVYADVSGYSFAPPAAGTTYFLGSEKGIETDQFEAREFFNHVERALSVKGLVRVPTPDQAQVIIFVGYGIGAPKEQIATYSVPTFGQTGVMSAHTFGTVSSYGTISATTTYTPSYGITGSMSHAYSYETYDRWLRLSAVDGPQLKLGKVQDIWRVDVKSTGSSGDLRQIFPIMAFVASKYVAIDTGKAVRTKTKVKAKDFQAFLQLPVSGIVPQTP